MDILFAVAAMICKVACDLLASYTIRTSNGQKVNLFYFMHMLAIVVLLTVMLPTGLLKVELDARSIISGVVIGILTFVVYLLYLNSIRGENSSVYITIYRLNFIVAAILGIVFLNESVTPGKMIGITFFLGAVFMFINLGELKKSRLEKNMVLSIISCVLLGFTSMIVKISFDSGITVDSIIVYRFYSVFLMTWIYSHAFNIRTKPKKTINKTVTYVLSAVSGGIMLLSMLFYYHALNIGELSVIAPITQSCFIFSSVISFFFIKEKITAKKIAGLIMAILCILSISL